MRMGKKFGPVLNRLWTRFTKFWGNVRDPSWFPASLPDCLCHVSFRRYSPLSVEVFEKPNKCKNFLATIFPGGGDDPTVLQQIVSAIYHLAKFG